MNTYKKGQVVYAIWNTFGNATCGIDLQKPDKKLGNRIDKLLSAGLLPDAERGGGPGKDNGFTEEQVFLIALALILMDMGQGLWAAAFFIHHTHDSLLNKYAEIRRNPPSHIAEKDPDEKMVYLMFQYRDLKEFYPNITKRKVEGWRGSSYPPIVLNPRYATGMEGIRESLKFYIQRGRQCHAEIIEIAKMSSLLLHNLKSAPIPKRGRPK